VPWWVWIPIGVFVVSLLAATAMMLRSLRSLARTSRSFQSRLTPVTASLAAATERLSQKNERLARDQTVASTTVHRLQSSIKQLQVLVDALHEVQVMLKFVRLVRAVR
jgi:hypothetical protein